MAFNAWMTATKKDPKQMEPKLVVTALRNAPYTGLFGVCKGCKKYHVATAPALVTCTVLAMT